MKNKTIEHIFSEKIAIIFSADENYIPYLAVTLQSLVANSSSTQNYDIVVIEKDISNNTKKKLQNIVHFHKNISLRYFNIKSFVEGHNFYILNHFSEATYFRIFIEKIFSGYEKVIYCDCDAVFCDDVAKLYDFDLKHKLIGAALDTEILKRLYSNNKKESDYFYKYLSLENPHNYFQAGFLIFNIAEICKFGLYEKFISTLNKVKAPKFVDQDILNIICENQVAFIPLRWNIENHILVYNTNLEKVLPQDALADYTDALNNKAFLHYSSSKKPWIFPDIPNAELWWHYARQTPFYEEIFYKNLKKLTLPNNNNNELLRDVFNYSQIRFNYYRCKLLANLTWGKKKEHYKEKKRKLKEKIRKVRRFLKEK